MLILVAIIYLLLCVRIRVQIDISVINLQGSAAFTVGAYGIYLRHEAAIVKKEHGIGFRLEPIKKAKKSGKRSVLQSAVQHILTPYLKEMVRQRRFAWLSVHMRLGLGDACGTAVAVGGARALLSALLAVLSRPGNFGLHVIPDFAAEGLQAHAQGIFFCQPGDIMLAALKAAKAKRKEGFTWTNIPLRA